MIMANLVPFNRRSREIAPVDSFFNMIDDFFSDPWLERSRFARDTFKVDIQETPEAYIVEAELPGIQKDEVAVDLRDGNLTIAVKREEKINEKKKNYIHQERRCSAMSRSIYLGDADADGVKARLENGVLSIDVPRQKKADHTKRIEIQ
jgi:HSP20 family protein